MIAPLESKSSTMAHDSLFLKWSRSAEIRAVWTGIDALNSEKKREEAENEDYEAHRLVEEPCKIWKTVREYLQLKCSETREKFGENSCSGPSDGQIIARRLRDEWYLPGNSKGFHWCLVF